MPGNNNNVHVQCRYINPLQYLTVAMFSTYLGYGTNYIFVNYVYEDKLFIVHYQPTSILPAIT